jgi:hypothetical protein
MQHDLDFTLEHPCKPLADYPPAFRRVLLFWGSVLPKDCTIGAARITHRASRQPALKLLIRRES